MTPKPKILQKVENISDEIVEAIATSESIYYPPDPVGYPIASEGILLHDFHVCLTDQDLGSRCSCYYGGQELYCERDKKTTLQERDKNIAEVNCMFNDCVVRKYAELCIKGFKKKAEGKK